MGHVTSCNYTHTLTHGIRYTHARSDCMPSTWMTSQGVWWQPWWYTTRYECDHVTRVLRIIQAAVTWPDHPNQELHKPNQWNAIRDTPTAYYLWATYKHKCMTERSSSPTTLNYCAIGLGNQCIDFLKADSPVLCSLHALRIIMNLDCISSFP